MTAAQLLLVVVVLLAATIGIAGCGNILIWFSLGCQSHYNLVKPLAMELAQRNHSITMVVPLPYPELEAMDNVNYIMVDTDISLALDSADMFEGRSIFGDVRHLFNMIREANNAQKTLLDNPGIQTLIKENSRFDATMIDAQFGSDLGLYLARKHFDSPVIELFAPLRYAGLDLAMGNPMNPSYVPMEMTGYSQYMTFTERVVNTIMTAVVLAANDLFVMPYMGNTLKELLQLDEAPDMTAMSYDFAFALVNTHAIFESVVPINPNTAWIGGIHLESGKKKKKELPEDFKSFLDGAQDGAILVSFGSMLNGSHLPEPKRQLLRETFSKLRQRVIWKWETETMEDKPENVMLRKWLPQQEILAHPNLRVFVSHGGLLSTEEALYHKVPMVVMPLCNDQFSNAARAERLGFGRELRWTNLDNTSLLETIESVLTDPTYQERANYLGTIFSDNIVSSLDKAVFHTEYVMRHKGAPHLRSPVKDLYWFQYFLLDVLVFVTVVLSAAIFIGYKIVKFIVCFICGRRARSDVIKKDS